jgi:uncharacterized protein YndB with AHSA1/START domain
MILKWVMGVVAVIVCLAALIYFIGLMLPRDHVARAEAVLPAPPAAVAALVSDVEGHPKWRSNVERIEVHERRPGTTRYTEHSGDGAIRFEFREESPGTRYRSTIVDPTLPFGGHWTIALQPETGGTRVSIEERGLVRSPIYRFFSALVFGHHGTMNQYLADLRQAVQP